MARSRYDDDDAYDDPRYDRRDEPRDRDRYGSDDRADDERGEPRQPPPNYLAPAIIVTILCCWPAGVVAIVKAASVNSKWYSGDYRGAREASESAKTWCWVSFGLIIPVIILVVAVQIAAIGGGGFKP